MLLSFASILLPGMIAGMILKKVKLPPLLGMLIVGIVIGPFCLNLIDEKTLSISSEIRQIALTIILIRAGLNLDLAALRKVGRPALLMCFVPACLEIIGMVLLAPLFLGVSYLEAAIMGAVTAAVSPAVIVPKMLELNEKKLGTDKSIPQMIMAGASVDDVFVIVLFSSFTGIASGNNFSLESFISIPISIIFGIIGGIGIGFIVAIILKKVQMCDTAKLLIIISSSFILISIENILKQYIAFSGMLAVMSMALIVSIKCPKKSKDLSARFTKLWFFAEIMLFVLVGATVNINHAVNSGIMSILLIFSVLIFRMCGVNLCLIKTNLSIKERFFCMIAYCPKATVQAAIGSIPLSMNLPCGNIVLTVAVLAILFTAPLGAFFIDLTKNKFLKQN